MIPNNNFSVLPWYTSIDQQNARKWWVYGRTYPLFTPAGFLPPFQLMRKSETTKEYTPDSELVYDTEWNDKAIIIVNGTISFVDSSEFQTLIQRFDVDGIDDVYFENIPDTNTPGSMSIAFTDENGNYLPSDSYTFVDDLFTGGMPVPDGAKYVYVQLYNEEFSQQIGIVYEADVTIITTPISDFRIYTREGQLVGEYPTVRDNIQIKTIGDYDYLVYPSNFPFAPSFENGQYYARIIAGTKMWFSEVFTVVNDIQPYLKIEWWDLEDFRMDAGAIVYKNPTFKNVLYLDATIAKPEYPFEEEGETRDGYFFPVKMISEKRYRFKFFAPEYLLDVMRFIRMADFANITANGQVYSLDTFLITPEWEDNGDVASVEAQFDTATVAKKIGVGYIKAQRGDFNDDFNNDFDI